ncbi:uncharacterized protein LOC123713451 [Pieris brassicae]|uniref:uncharacterized protein LOC123713451 n=1 Tax=Pieris brassicae TaxID=7116 RepID=UPI001E660AD9|nr:uncharacterized protein LOC123713451 [Pieris brassicae]
MSIMLAVSAVQGGGVTKPSGLAQFWMDDIKALDQIYGKTSDKQLYGATLPPTITFDFDLNKKIKAQESKKNERFASLNNDDTGSDEQLQSFTFGDRYAKLFGKNLKSEHKVKTKTKPLSFVGLSNFKPISHSSDPEMYSYLRHLDDYQSYKADLSETESDFKPYKAKTEEEEAYRSIQDILEAHEANKGLKAESDFNDSIEKYPRYEPKDEEEFPRYAANAKPMKSKVRFLKNNNLRSRCRSGRCRKRLSTSYRSGSRPYIRKIKRYRIA